MVLCSSREYMYMRVPKDQTKNDISKYTEILKENALQNKKIKPVHKKKRSGLSLFWKWARVCSQNAVDIKYTINSYEVEPRLWHSRPAVQPAPRGSTLPLHTPRIVGFDLKTNQHNFLMQIKRQQQASSFWLSFVLF